MALIAQTGAIGHQEVPRDMLPIMQRDVASGFGAVLWFVLLAATGIALMSGSGAALNTRAGDVRRQLDSEEAQWLRRQRKRKRKDRRPWWRL